MPFRALHPTHIRILNQTMAACATCDACVCHTPDRAAAPCPGAAEVGA